MTWNFADSFDLYATAADAINGYWDSGNANLTLVAGRFTGSRAGQFGSGTTIIVLAKSSGVNDAVHHLVISFEQTAALSGTSLGANFQLLDGTTAQCSIVFKSNGDILLTSGGPTGSVLDTYTGAVTANNTWFAFEFEVVINGTTGSWAVRKNGNNVNDHSLGSLNTQNSANAYANKLQLAIATTVSNQIIDDLFWRSGASTGTWLGDIRCYTRMPATDSSVQFSRVSSATQINGTASGSLAIAAGTARYTPITSAYDGTINAVAVVLAAGYSGNMKCTMFASSGSAPTTVLGSATTVVNPVTGSNSFSFGTPITVVKGTQYWFGFCSDTSSGSWNLSSLGSVGATSVTAYASFPVATPTATTGQGCPPTTAGFNSITTNYCLVAEAQEDSGTTYVYDSNPGDADFYGIATITTTPATVIATVVRAYMMKSDAGTRTAAVQLKSGGTTVASTTTALTTSGWQWLYRMDLTDPNTAGSAWTPTTVNNALIGPTVIA